MASTGSRENSRPASREKAALSVSARRILVDDIPEESLHQLDLDGDGQVGKTEIIAAGKGLKELKQKNRFLKLVVLGMVIFLLVLAAIVLGATLVAIMVSKDMKVNDEESSLTDNSGNLVATRNTYVMATASSLADLIEAPLKSLEELDHVGATFEGEEDSFQFVVTGFIQLKTEKMLHLFLGSVGVMTVTPDTMTVKLTEEFNTLVGEIFATAADNEIATAKFYPQKKRTKKKFGKGVKRNGKRHHY